MGRALLVLNSAAERARAARWITQAPPGTRVEFKATKRTLPQNDRMWAMLTDVATQTEHYGRRYTPDQWKVLFMHACGREVQFLPSLDGSTFIPWGQSSSDLGKEEMTALIEFIESWAAEKGIVLGKNKGDGDDQVTRAA
jgi:NinB protein